MDCKRKWTDEKFFPVQTISKYMKFRARNVKSCLLILMFLYLNSLLCPVLLNKLNVVSLKFFDSTQFSFCSEMIMRSDSSLSVFFLSMIMEHKLEGSTNGR